MNSEALLKRFKESKSRRDPWEPLWRRAFNYSVPNKEVFTNRSKGAQRNAQVFDETAVRSVPKFATRIQAALVPSWAQWAKLVPASALSEEVEIPEAFAEVIQGDDSEEVLESYTDRVFEYIHHSNFASQAFEAFQDLSISTAALFIESDETDVFKCTAVPLHTFYRDVYCEKTFWREHEIECANILSRWPDAKLPSELTQQIENKPETKVKVIEGTIYDKEMGEYELVIMLDKQKTIIFEENFGASSPWVVFGWDMTPGELYHRGPVLSVLPAILSLNKMCEILLQNSALKAAGVWTGSMGDGSWNPNNVRIIPGTVIPVGTNESSNPSIRPLDVGGDLQYVDYVITQKTRVVEEALFANPMGDVGEAPVRTLGENMMRVQDMLQQAGASFSLLERDFVAASLKRIVHLLTEAGKVPEIKIDGEAITIKMQSPLAQARDAEGLGSLDQFFASVAALGPEYMRVLLDGEKVYEYAQQHTGLPADFINDEEKQEAAMQAMMAAQQQPQQ